MEEEAVRWNIKVSKETDLTLRTYLGSQGMKKGDLSKFIEEAVRWRVFHRTVQSIKEQNADTDPAELQRLIDTAARGTGRCGTGRCGTDEITPKRKSRAKATGFYPLAFCHPDAAAWGMRGDAGEFGDHDTYSPAAGCGHTMPISAWLGRGVRYERSKGRRPGGRNLT
jgi:hypothetical protein